MHSFHFLKMIKHDQTALEAMTSVGLGRPAWRFECTTRSSRALATSQTCQSWSHMFCILLRHDIINVNENNIHKLQSSVEIVMIISDINWYELPVVVSMMMEGYYYIKNDELYDIRLSICDVPWTSLGLGKRSSLERSKSSLTRTLAMGTCDNGTS